MHTHLTRVHLKGFRNIQDTETTFREGLNIIIGPNGCGKTNFLWLLANIDKEEINDLDISAEIEYVNAFFEDRVLNDLKVEINHSMSLNNKITKVVTSFGKYHSSTYTETILDRLLLTFNIPSVIDCFTLAKSLSISLLEYASYYNTIVNSNNTALNYLFFDRRFPKTRQFAIEDLNFLPSIIDTLKKYTPIEDIRVEFPVREDEIKKVSDTKLQISNLLYGFKINGEWFKWHELSDGTRRIVWIVLNVLSNNSSIIFIEEPELGIHPHQLKLLMQFIKEQSKHKQIILTTHAPEVLDILDADELDRIRIARYDEERKTTVIEGIPVKRQAIIQKYMQKTGLLSGFWSRIDLEGTKGFPKQ